MPWWEQLSSTYRKLRKPVNNPAQIQAGYYQVNQWRGRKKWVQQKHRTTITQVLWPLAAPVLHWCLPQAFPTPRPVTRGGGKKKKFCTLDWSWRKEEEMGLKLQRKERSADQEEPFFPISKNTQSWKHAVQKSRDSLNPTSFLAPHWKGTFLLTEALSNQAPP